MTFVQKQATIGKSSGNSTTKNEIKPLDQNFVYYTVKRGDTLWDIAQKYADVSSKEIMSLNNLSSGRSLYIGQKLKIKKRM